MLFRVASFYQSQLACHGSRLSCKQSLRNTGDWQRHIDTQNAYLWTDRLCSVACCLLKAYDALKAQSVLKQLFLELDAVLANAGLYTCFCSLCRTSLSIMAQKVSRWQTGGTSQKSAGQLNTTSYMLQPSQARTSPCHQLIQISCRAGKPCSACIHANGHQTPHSMSNMHTAKNEQSKMYDASMLVAGIPNLNIDLQQCSSMTSNHTS